MTLPSVSYLLKRASAVPDDVYDRLQQREGGHTKVTKDQGGVTKGGIAESGGQYTAEQIRKLTPGQIRDAYNPYWQSSGQHFQNPAAAEVAFDMAVNAGPPRTAGIIQKTLNQMTPGMPPLPGSGKIGPQTQARMAVVDQSDLARRLYGAFGQHHEQLVADNPKRHGASAKGWANRRDKLAQSPVVGQVLAGKNLPQVFKGIPPKGAIIVPTDPSPSRSSILKAGSAPGDLTKLLAVLTRAKAIKRDLGADAADRFTMGQVGSTLRAAIARSRNQAAPKAAPSAPAGPPQQSQFQFMDKQGSVASLLRRAINCTHTHPTPGQIEAGNYAKGEFPWQGMRIKIENPEGTTRRGVCKGKTWSRVMTCCYGYFKSTTGKDGDALDVFVGPDLDSDLVAVIDQMIDGKFDEHKVVVAVKTEAQARKLYLSNYTKGWTCGPLTMTTADQLKTWLKDGDTKKPFAGQLVKTAKNSRHTTMQTPFAKLVGAPSQATNAAYATGAAGHAVSYFGGAK